MRSSFHHALPSALARQLARGLPVGASADAPRQDVAERLGQWLNVAEAIELHAAQSAVTAAGAAASRRPPRVEPAALHASLRAELDRVRSVLSRSITTRPAHKPDPNDLDTEFAFFHQRLGDQQRRMEMSVDALREHVRQQLAQSTPAMAQLAALDAVMDQLFGGREQRLLSQLPAFLKARFAALRQEAARPDTPDDLRWLHAFATEFEQTLLSELDLRLQPVTGLIEALAHEH
ncbi:DUF3348 family protein [Hydrogenophaga sp. MI9]|uniref:DUF3348 family protein n=1 Tax=Hydrogenophaga sp. MI9 TaxID=3453719 RepID=UPI003EE9E535